MSRRDRRNKRSESPARPDSPPRDPGSPILKGTILLTALALVASAVFFWQITRPTSFLSAILQVEYSRLLPPEKGKPRADGGPTWETVYQQYQERLRKEPVTQRHFAVSDLLDAVVEVERGRRLAGEAVGKMQSRFAVDGDNAISRLAFGALVDAGAAGKSATERFDEWRRVVEQPGVAKVSALYNKEYDDVFADVLSGYIKRLDVRANLVKYMDHFLIADHYAALPMIQARLAKLADELSAAGKTTEAESCRRWFVRACLGLMEYEPDAGTRLLCADLAGRCVPEGDPLHVALARLRDKYVRMASGFPTDLTHLGRAPSVSFDLHQDMTSQLFVTVTYAAEGAGCVFMLLLASVFAVSSRQIPVTRAKTHDTMAPTAAAKTTWIFPPLMVILQTITLGTSMSKNALSEVHVVCWLIGVAALGSTTALFGSAMTEGGQETRARQLAIGFFWTLCLTLIVLVAKKLAPMPLIFGMGMTGPLIVGGFLTALLVAALWYRTASLATIARVCCATWLACMGCALCGLAVTAYSDSHWQTTTAEGRRDEFTARLGAQWRDTYGIKLSVDQAPTTGASQ